MQGSIGLTEDILLYLGMKIGLWLNQYYFCCMNWLPVVTQSCISTIIIIYIGGMDQLSKKQVRSLPLINQNVSKNQVTAKTSG